MPLVDLLLQLFIAAIIFFPVVEYGLHINLPKGTTDPIQRERSRTVVVDRVGRLYLNDVPKTRQQLRADFQSLVVQQPDITVLVKADQFNNYGTVMEVLTDLHAVGVKRIALLSQEDTRSQ